MAELLAERYRLGELLGRGGMGWVQRAVDVLSGLPVAVKFLHAEGQPERLAMAFSWEVGAVARLDHPGVVPLYDFGRTGEGQPYIVMGLSPGTPLSQIPREAISWPTFCALLERIFEVLSHTHARGVFHHDLKPGNVLVHADGEGAVRVQVIDFGIAGVMGGQGLGTGAGPTGLMGTASYMAPELVRAHELYRFSASPDLYALGVMAYELAYGRRPFVADDARDVLRMHQTDEPPTLPFRAGFAAPPPLHFFIRKMLAKSPRDRFGSATEALALLRQMAPRDALGGRHRTRDLPAQRFRADSDEPEAKPRRSTPHDHFKLLGVRPPSFTGRQPERHFLSSRLADCIVRQVPQVVLLTGPAGVGKSQLVRYLAQWAAEQGRASVAVAPYSLSGSDSVEGWRAVLLGLLGYVSATRELIAATMADDLRWLGLGGEIAPELVLDLLFPPEAAEAAEGAEAVAFDWVGTYLRLLAALARKRPLLIALEDVISADDARGIEVLEFLLRAGEASSISVVLTMRSEGLGDVGVAEAELKRLERYPGFVKARLSGLNTDEMSALLDGLMPLEVGLRQRVARASKGFPIYAVELLRYWVRTRVLEQRNGSCTLKTEVERLPESADEVWNARLELVGRGGAFGRDQLDLLQRAAVLGQLVTYEGLRQLLACEEGGSRLEGRLSEVWEAWHAEGLWEQLAPGHSVFVHTSLRQAALARLQPEELRSLHRTSAQALLRAAGSEAFDVARHYALAGLAQEAFPLYLSAARSAYRNGRAPAAVSHCRRAAQLLLDSGAAPLDRRWGVVYRLLAESLLRLSRFDDVEEIASRLEERARRWDDNLYRATALRLVATSRWRRGQPREAEEKLVEARDLFRAQGVHRELARCELELGDLWRDRRPPEEIREQYRLARRHFGMVRDSHGTAEALVAEARLLRELGELGQAEQFLGDAFNIFKRLGDRTGMAEVTRHRGRLTLVQERHGPALDAFAEASQLYRSVGDREGVAACTLETGHAYRALGQLSQAEQCFRLAREEFIALGNRIHSIQAHLGLVQLAIDSGHFAPSLPHLDALLAEIRRMGDQGLEMVAEALKARCASELGQWPEADASLVRVEAVLEQLRLVHPDVARQLERVGHLALQAEQGVIATTALAASQGIWERMQRTDDGAGVAAPPGAEG